jgi:hypothetical protein
MKIILILTLIATAALAADRLQVDRFKVTTATLPSVGLSWPAGQVLVFRNGLLLDPAMDYTRKDRIITFSPASVPKAGDVIQVVYWTPVALHGYGVQ